MTKPLGKSKIDWLANEDVPGYILHATTGCTKCSPGCASCYALRMLGRKLRNKRTGRWFLDHDPAGPAVQCHPEQLDRLAVTKPGVVFVSPFGDLFHEDVPEEFLARVWGTMGLAKEHTLVVLTKRPERMAAFAYDFRALSNVYLGVTVCTQTEADAKLPVLARIAEAGWDTWVSVEPQLESVSLNVFCNDGAHLPHNQPLGGARWVVCGCESGPSARPFEADWARSLRDQCAAARVPFYFKQRPRHVCRKCREEVWRITYVDPDRRLSRWACQKCGAHRTDAECLRSGVEHTPLLDGVRHTAVPWGGGRDA